MISRNRPGLNIDEQAMNEAILNPHASQRRRSYGEGRGADSEYANVVEELRQLRAASQLKEGRPPVRDEAYYVRNFGRARAHA